MGADRSFPPARGASCLLMIVTHTGCVVHSNSGKVMVENVPVHWLKAMLSVGHVANTLCANVPKKKSKSNHFCVFYRHLCPAVMTVTSVYGLQSD